MLYKYTPEKMYSTKSHKFLPVVGIVAYPKEKHKDKPIKNDFACISFTLSDGSLRYWGCERAYINSELRMIAVFDNTKVISELILAWEDVPENGKD